MKFKVRRWYNGGASMTVWSGINSINLKNSSIEKGDAIYLKTQCEVQNHQPLILLHQQHQWGYYKAYE